MENIVPVWCLDQCANGTHQGALAAGDALGISQGLIENGDSYAVRASLCKSDDVLLLSMLTTSLYTQAAFNAFREVSPDAGRGVIHQPVFWMFFGSNG